MVKPLSENTVIKPEKTVIKPTNPKSEGNNSLEVIKLAKKLISWLKYVYPPTTKIFLRKVFLKDIKINYHSPGKTFNCRVNFFFKRNFNRWA